MKHVSKLEEIFDQEKGLQIKTSELHLFVPLSIARP